MRVECREDFWAESLCQHAACGKPQRCHQNEIGSLGVAELSLKGHLWCHVPCLSISGRFNTTTLIWRPILFLLWYFFFIRSGTYVSPVMWTVLVGKSRADTAAQRASEVIEEPGLFSFLFPYPLDVVFTLLVAKEKGNMKKKLNVLIRKNLN